MNSVTWKEIVDVWNSNNGLRYTIYGSGRSRLPKRVFLGRLGKMDLWAELDNIFGESDPWFTYMICDINLDDLSKTWKCKQSRLLSLSNRAGKRLIAKEQKNRKPDPLWRKVAKRRWKTLNA